MRGVDEGAGETEPKVRGVLVLAEPIAENDGLREWARSHGLVIVGEWAELGAGAIELALKRRVDSPGRSRLCCGPLRLEPEAGEFTIGGARLELRRTERDVLTYLMQHAHRFVTPKELQQQVLRTHGGGGAARNQVYELRRKLRAAGYAEAIETRPQKGYRLRFAD